MRHPQAIRRRIQRRGNDRGIIDVRPDRGASSNPARPARAYPGPSGAEIIALVLMGIGGIMLPLIAPVVGVLVMRSTPRWSVGQVRATWGILGIGLLAAFGLLALATVPNAPGWAVAATLALLGVIFIVGPVAALYAASRPRPGQA